jgi:hypothetical protein
VDRPDIENFKMTITIPDDDLWPRGNFPFTDTTFTLGSGAVSLG